MTRTAVKTCKRKQLTPAVIGGLLVGAVFGIPAGGDTKMKVGQGVIAAVAGALAIYIGASIMRCS